MKKSQAGVTLIEIVLVLAIGAMIILFSIRQYELFKVDGDVRQLQVNVDQFFEAMSKFYQAQCYGTTRSNLNPATVSYGRLHPRVTSTTPFPITPVTDLQTPGYIAANNFPLSPLVNTSGPAASAPYNGFVLQFNRTTEPRVVCTRACTSTPATGITSAENCCATAQTGTTVVWNPQVAVLLQNPATALAFLRLLGGDCLSSLSGSIVTPCSGTGTGSGNYVVWQRPASYVSQEGATDSMELNPTAKQFTNMYRVNPVTNLTDRSHTTEFQYYVCGS